jgi:hypothetical protein
VRTEKLGLCDGRFSDCCRKTVCKVRGITLNYAFSELVNFDLFKNMVLNVNETATVTVHTDKKIKRKREGAGFQILT